MKNAKILIVEDDNDLNTAYNMILESAGHDVSTAFNGVEALEYIKKNGDPSIIFLDLRMPIMDGIGFLKNFDTSKHKNTTVIIFSNYDAQNEVDEAYKLGAERYILKARASPGELVRMVDKVLADKA